MHNKQKAKQFSSFSTQSNSMRCHDVPRHLSRTHQHSHPFQPSCHCQYHYCTPIQHHQSTHGNLARMTCARNGSIRIDFECMLSFLPACLPACSCTTKQQSGKKRSFTIALNRARYVTPFRSHQ